MDSNFQHAESVHSCWKWWPSRSASRAVGRKPFSSFWNERECDDQLIYDSTRSLGDAVSNRGCYVRRSRVLHKARFAALCAPKPVHPAHRWVVRDLVARVLIYDPCVDGSVLSKTKSCAGLLLFADHIQQRYHAIYDWKRNRYKHRLLRCHKAGAHHGRSRHEQAARPASRHSQRPRISPKAWMPLVRASQPALP